MVGGEGLELISGVFRRILDSFVQTIPLNSLIRNRCSSLKMNLKLRLNTCMFSFYLDLYNSFYDSANKVFSKASFERIRVQHPVKYSA